ncbi:vitamin K epoxide reductase family protein [Desulfobacterium sp. N47]|uniref:vitamin K epoxide reductase/DsbA family protein n=1 Tax=Desulfobacterium sp. N47 TaxID=3115210 RepID=UPI003C895F93
MINKIISKRYDIKSFPFPVYSGTIAFLLLAGLADSIYLSLHHYLIYTDIGYESFCAISKAINCDTVSQSPYSVLLGMPVALWGLFAYCFCIFLLPFAYHSDAGRKRIWRLFFAVSLIFSFVSIIFAIISTIYIHSYCIMCIASYGINFLLVFYSWLIIRRFGEKEGIITGLKRDAKFIVSKKRLFLSLATSYIILFVSVYTFYPVYWNLTPPPLSANVPNGITEDGHPWIGGSQNPELVITEYTDYLCFQCKKMHFFLRQIVEKNPEKIRLIHRHYPMDNKYNPLVKEPFHIGSGNMAILSIYAESKGKFWEMNDALFDIDKKDKSINIKKLAEKTGLDSKELATARYDNKIRHALWLDIKDGLKLGITGTPAYVINGKLYLGEIPADILKKIIE